jgi:dolichol-phosphate mannosyltransferase
LISIVAPFYNEEENAPVFYQELKAILASLPFQYEMVFVDDGSVDNTLQVLKNLAEQDPSITLLALSRNFGHQLALTAGLDYAAGDIVIVMDSDLQHPPEIIPALVEEYQNGADVVYAVRSNDRGVGLFKRLSSRGYYSLLGRLTNVQIIPGSADFRLMRRDVVETLREMRETHRYLRGLVPWIGWKSATVSYQQPKRRAGRPSYTWSKSMQLARHGIFSFSTLPLEIISWLGLIFAVLGGIYLVYILIISLFGIAVQGWTSTISAVLILGGVQLLSLGIVAQYIGMIFEQVKERPLYVLKYKKIANSQESGESLDG